MRITIDPGHGGGDPGAVARDGTREADLALLLARRIKEPLVAAGHIIGWTRTTDIRVHLTERARIADRQRAGLFLSVHCNSAADRRARGFEVVYAAPDPESAELGRRIVRALSLIYPGVVIRGVIPDTRTPHGSLTVLRRNYRKRRAVLLECGFMSNPADLEMMRRPEYGLAIGRAVVAAIGEA